MTQFLIINFAVLALLMVVRIWVLRRQAAKLGQPPGPPPAPAESDSFPAQKTLIRDTSIAVPPAPAGDIASPSPDAPKASPIKETSGKGTRINVPPPPGLAPEEMPSDRPPETSPFPPIEQNGGSVPPFMDDTFAAEGSPDEYAEITNFTVPASTRIAAIKKAGDTSATEAVPRLCEALYDPDMGISGAAAEALGKIGDPRAIEHLLVACHKSDMQLLEDEPPTPIKIDVETAQEAPEKNESKAMEVVNPFKYKEMTLFRLDLLPKEYFQADGTPIPRKELVLKGLKDNDQQLRKIAAKTAIGLSDPELEESLIETLRNPYEVESVRYLAAEALGGMEGDRAKDTLIQALGDQNIAVRYSAAAALCKFKESKVVDALVKSLGDPNEFVRSSVAYALGQLGNKEALDALFLAMKDDQEVVRFSVAKALGAIGGEKVMKGLEERMQAPDNKLKTAIVEILGQLKEDKAIELLRQALRDPDSEVSYRASLALMNQESLEALEDLIEASKRLDSELLGWVHDGGSKTSGKNGNGPLKEFSELKMVSGKKEEEALDKLRTALHHESPNVRGCAANTLGDFRVEEARDLLQAALKDPHEYVRSTAVSSLAKMGNPAVVNNFLELLQDPSEDVRYALAKALGNFSDRKATFGLNKLVESDPSKDVRRVAKKELEKITQAAK